jgi:hypothetical protein
MAMVFGAVGGAVLAPPIAAEAYPGQADPGVGNLFVTSVESSDGAFGGGEPLAGWSITVEGNSSATDGFEGTLVTDDLGVAGFGAIPAGSYEVCIAERGGFEVVGSTLNESDQATGACREVTIGAEDSVVAFLIAREAGGTPTPTATPATSLFPLPTASPTPVAVRTPPSPPDPTATPPGTGGSSSPTPIDAVAGERTPGTGAQPTPLAPATGSGASQTTGAGLALAGLAGVLGGVVLAWRGARRGD